MKALLFSDLHASNSSLYNLKKLLLEDKSIDLIICAGDIVNMGEPVPFVGQFIKTINELSRPFFWVPGNNDFGRAYHKLTAWQKSLEGKIVVFNDLNFTGVGGSPASWAGQYAGERMIDRKSIAGSIFVSHVPPPGVLSFSKIDIAKPQSLKHYKDAPKLHLCGHLHSRSGIAYLGRTKVVNAGPLSWGQYAIIDLDSLEVKLEKFPRPLFIN